jgi:hypothetical protein
MGLVEVFRKVFQPEAENVHDLIMQSEHKASGWYRDLDRLGRFIGYSWFCPGRVIHATMPAPRGSGGEAEIPIQQRIGCSCVIGTLTPDENGIANIEAKCGQCTTTSSLVKYLRDRNISARDLPTRTRTTPATQSRIHDTWKGYGDSDEGYEYSRSNPGGFL